MAHAGQEIRGPGEYRLRLIRTAAETGGELLEMEATYGADGQMPPEHFHPSQVERFEVLEGAVSTRIEGVERRYETGEQFEVPAGCPHTMTGDGPARMRWRVTPALRTAEFFERLFAGNPTGPGGEGGFEAFLEEFRDEIRFTTG